tara:strand:- start:175 stop:531 length:357 start_codon:yes stop_codon:yes gene_type:complete
MDTNTFIKAFRNYVISIVSEEGSRTDEDFVDRRIELAFDDFQYTSTLERIIEAKVESYLEARVESYLDGRLETYLDNNLDDACEQALMDRQYMIKDVVDETLQNVHINITSEAEIEIN